MERPSRSCKSVYAKAKEGDSQAATAESTTTTTTPPSCKRLEVSVCPISPESAQKMGSQKRKSDHPQRGAMSPAKVVNEKILPLPVTDLESPAPSNSGSTPTEMEIKETAGFEMEVVNSQKRTGAVVKGTPKRCRQSSIKREIVESDRSDTVKGVSGEANGVLPTPAKCSTPSTEIQETPGVERATCASENRARTRSESTLYFIVKKDSKGRMVIKEGDESRTGKDSSIPQAKVVDQKGEKLVGDADESNAPLTTSKSGSNCPNSNDVECSVDDERTSERSISASSDGTVESKDENEDSIKNFSVEREVACAISLLMTRMQELAKVKQELEKAKKHIVKVKEKSRKHAEETEKRMQAKLEDTVKREVESAKRKAEIEITDAKRVAQDWKFRHKDQMGKHKEMMASLEELANSQLQEMKKQSAEALEAERSKAKQEAAAAAQAANDRMQKKIETVQRQMQGKIEAAEKEKKKQVEDVQRAAKKEIEEIQKSAKKEIEQFQKKAEYAAVKYNKLIAEHVVLQSRMSDAANLLSSVKGSSQGSNNNT